MVCIPIEMFRLDKAQIAYSALNANMGRVELLRTAFAVDFTSFYTSALC